jgi:hypothetical protein
MMEPTKQTTFRATVLPEGDEWIAHCLDLDIVATGPTHESAFNELLEAVGLQLAYAREQDNYEYLIRLAPLEAWQKFAEIMSGPHETIVRPIDDSDGGENLLEAQRAA